MAYVGAGLLLGDTMLLWSGGGDVLGGETRKLCLDACVSAYGSYFSTTVAFWGGSEDWNELTDATDLQASVANERRNTVWCSEIGSLTSLEAFKSGACSDGGEPISLHQSVHGKKTTQL